MFDHIGGKIKKLAVLISVIGIAASVIAAIALWTQNSYRTPTIALGFGVLVGGCIGSWVGSFFMYGFGELIEETTRTREISQMILQQMKSVNEERAPSSASRDVPVAFSSERRTDGALRAHALSASSSANGWICKKCGTRNGSRDISCKDCGAYK